MKLIGNRFYQNIRRLLRDWRHNKKIAKSISPDDILQFRGVLSLSAPQYEIERLQSPTALNPYYQIDINDFCLWGMVGALPVQYTEWMINQKYRYNDHVLSDFLDIFNHRINSLRFQTWAKCRLYICAELQGVDHFPKIMQGIAGRLESAYIPVANHYAYLFANRTRSMSSLQYLLQRHLGVPVDIHPFQGTWQKIEPALCCQLGQLSLSLGEGPMLGKAYWDNHFAFHLCLGPFPQAKLDSFLPNGAAYKWLFFWVKEYVGPLLNFSLELKVIFSSLYQKIDGAGQLGYNMSIGQCIKNTISSIYVSQYDK